MATSSATRRAEWWIPASLMLLSLVPAIAGSARLGALASGAAVTPANARFVAAPAPVVIHILSALPFSILGALQFAPGFRRRHRGLHRLIGRLLVPAGFGVALSGLWMTLSYPWPAGDGVALYWLRLLFGSAMLASMVAGVDAIRRRDFTAHAAWMTRAYAIGLGAGTQVLTHLPWFILMAGAPGEGPRAIMMGAGWVINVVVAELAIRRMTPAVRRPLAGRPAIAPEGAAVLQRRVVVMAEARATRSYSSASSAVFEAPRPESGAPQLGQKRSPPVTM